MTYEMTREQARDVKVGLVAGLASAEWSGQHEDCDGTCFICEGLRAIAAVLGERPAQPMSSSALKAREVGHR